MRGQVIGLTRDKGYGFVRGEDGVARFFHARDILPHIRAFDSFDLGQSVEFVALETARGPRAVQVEQVDICSPESVERSKS